MSNKDTPPRIYHSVQMFFLQPFALTKRYTLPACNTVPSDGCIVVCAVDLAFAFFAIDFRLCHWEELFSFLGLVLR